MLSPLKLYFNLIIYYFITFSLPINAVAIDLLGTQRCSGYSARLQSLRSFLNLGAGTSCWKIGSYLPMPGGLQCRILTN